MKRKLVCLLPLLAAPLQAQRLHCGLVTLSNSATCAETANGITISLLGPSRIGWTSFTIPAGQVLRMESAAGSSFPSLHVSTSRTSARIDGAVIADGAFSLVSRGGINVGATGSINAPSVFLSTHSPANETDLLNGGSTTFSENGASAGITVNGTVQSAQGSTVLLSHNVTINSGATMQAAGQLQINAARAGASGSHSNIAVAADPEGDAGVQNLGSLQGASVVMVAQGYVRNAGAILSQGPTGLVSLTAPEIRNETQGNITTTRLITTGNFTNQGKVIFPDDGANPGGVNATRQLPSLTGSRISTQTVTKLDATRLNYNQLQDAKLPSLTGGPVKQASNLALRQGETTADEQKKAKSGPAKAGTIVRRGFFGKVGAGR